MVIEGLPQRPELIPALAAWFEAEWADHYATQPAGTAEQQFREGDWFVALDGDTPVGVVAIRDYPLPELTALSPSIGGLYVLADQRRRGVGRALVCQATSALKVRGEVRVYAATVSAANILTDLGWVLIDTILHDERHGSEPIGLYRADLTT